MLRDGETKVIDTEIGGDQVGEMGQSIKLKATRVGEDLVLMQVDSVNPDRVLVTGVFFEERYTADPWIDAVIIALQEISGVG